MLSGIRYSARSFLRRPGLTLALLLTMAFGIGGNVSLQGFVRGLTRPDPLLTTDGRVVSIFGRDLRQEAGPVSYQDYRLLTGRRWLFEWIGAARIAPRTITLAGEAAIVPVAAVTPDLARLLGLSLDKGVVISYRLWQSEFGGKAEVRGDAVRVDGVDARVSDVAPRWLEGVYRDRAVDVWTPLDESHLPGVSGSSRNCWVLGRLRNGVTMSQAQAAVDTLRVLRYSGMTPETAVGLSRIGTLLGFAASAVFFIACANVASFLLGRAFARSHETSLRVALGASRGQLARELLWDSVVISVAGGACGLLLALWTARVVPALLVEQDAERLLLAADVLSTVAWSGACVGITMVCGLLPFLVIPYNRPASVLRREGAGPSKAIQRLRLGLVAAQMASCCVLVICTAFLLNGLHAELETSAGRRLSHAMLATVQARAETGIEYFRKVEQATRSMAGVSGVTWTGQLPGGQPAWHSFRIEPRQTALREVRMDTASFSGDSLKLFAMPPKAGRLFGYEDRTCRSAIVNEKAAEQLFGDSTVGRTVQDSTGRSVNVIGVVATRGVATPVLYYDNAETPMAGARFRVPIATNLAGAELDANVVSANYFEAAGLSLIAGQKLPALQGCRVGILNEEAADLYFGGKAVGGAVIDEQGRRTEIVGVVHAAALGNLQRQVEPAIYFPMAQEMLPRMTMMVLTREGNDRLPAELQRVIESVPGRGPAPLVLTTLEAQLTRTALAPLRIATVLIGACAGAAILLSVLGLFGALSDAARHRRRELAMRVALGAQRWRVIGQVLMEGGRLAGAGVLAGTLGSMVLLRLLTRIAPGSGSPAWWVWLTAPLVLAVAVALASVLPARRALLVNPLLMLRDER